MDINIGTPALLFPAIAILMLGFVNRYIAVAGVVRTFKKDYDTGYTHTEIVQQLKFLRRRLFILRTMLEISVTALMLACLSMFFIFTGYALVGGAFFGFSVVGMLMALCFSLYETSLSNMSLNIEIDDILAKEQI